MPPRARAGMSRSTRSAALPLVFLLLALSTVFLSGNERGQIYRGMHHSAVTSHHMAVAENLSPKHNFLGIYSLTLDQDGAPSYRPYNRFPIGGYALVRLAVLPFEGDISASLHSARILMLVFFVCTGVLAYLSLCRLMGDRWIALTATLAAFSSYWLLYYNDMVATENMPSLFGVMLTFHGMVVFVQEGRFRQLLAKACAALLLGWHVYALLLPFTAFGLARRVLPSPPRGSVQSGAGGAPSFGPYLTLGIVTLLFGGAVLSLNLVNEYFAFGGKIPFTEMPTMKSMFKRFGASDGFNAHYAERLAWLPFLEEQFRRIGGMIVPYGLIGPIWGSAAGQSGDISSLWGLFIPGMIASGVCLIGLPFIRHGLLMAVLVLSGFCWALPMRHQVFFHQYEAIFYVGIPLAAFCIIFLCIRKLTGERYVPALAALALPVFVLSCTKMAGVGLPVRAATAEAELMQDFQAIRDVLGQGVVYIPYGQREGAIGRDRERHFLAGSVVLQPWQSRHREKAGFLLLRHRDEGPALLTPDNRRMFLYDRALYDASYDTQALGDPIIASDWNVYLRDGRLIYVSEDCASSKAPFFLSMVPHEAEGRPEHGGRPGLDRMEFRFRDFARIKDGGCVAAVDLPEYELASVRTGQSGKEDPLWEGEYRFPR